MKEYKRAAHNKFLSIAKYGLIKTNEDLPDNEDLRIPRISIHLVNRVSGFEMDLNSREILYTTTRKWQVTTRYGRRFTRHADVRITAITVRWFGISGTGFAHVRPRM